MHTGFMADYIFSYHHHYIDQGCSFESASLSFGPSSVSLLRSECGCPSPYILLKWFLQICLCPSFLPVNSFVTSNLSNLKNFLGYVFWWSITVVSKTFVLTVIYGIPYDLKYNFPTVISMVYVTLLRHDFE